KTTQQIVNEQFEWGVRLKKGEIEIPDKFHDTYIMLGDYYRKNLASVLSQEFADNGLVRCFMSIGTLIMTIKVRRNRKHPRVSIPTKDTSVDEVTSQEALPDTESQGYEAEEDAE